jgi:REP element-mobilizing transposase RayT
MPEYRRSHALGGTFFLTLVTYRRAPLFSEPENVSRLRAAIVKTRTEKPFEITGAAVLPDHIHFLWTLPPGDSDYSQRVSRLKILFTRSPLRGSQKSKVKSHYLRMFLLPVANIEKVIFGNVGFGSIPFAMKQTGQNI